jgi:branched-chain amino acid transport system substrate-binding protein
MSALTRFAATQASPRNASRRNALLAGLATTIAALWLPVFAPAHAQEPIKIGSSVGLSGYASVTDRAWRDGLLLAADALNAKGGALGRKFEIVVEDNKSEPQEAVVVYKKMIASDKVGSFNSGCVSAGTFAAAASVIAAELPMVLCSILPRKPEEQKWAFSFLPPPKFEIETRYQYLKEKTQIKKVGILHDPTPYGLLMTDIATKSAAEFGLEVVANESYKQDDADMSVQLGKINGAGAGAVIKIGIGGSTVTAAKNIKQLGLDKLLLLGSTDDAAIFKPTAESIGERFMFVAPGVQVPDEIADPTAKAKAAEFLAVWNAKYPGRDGTISARAWDSLFMMADAMNASKAAGGSALRDAFEKLPATQGAGAAYAFTPEQHVGIVKNPFQMGTVKGDKLVLVK